MATSITSMGTLYSEYQAFQNSLANGLAALKAVQAAGTVLYQDPNFATAFPTQWAAFQTYLLSANTAINNFINGFPAQPPLNN